MESLEELLPGIENYLSNVLAKEKLSKSAEKKRQYFVERLDVLKLPPSLPPRPPDGLPKSQRGQDFIAKQRALARENADPTKLNGDFTIDDEYDDVDIDLSLDFNPEADVNANNFDDDLYEIPQTHDGEEGDQPAFSDDDSGTSYESFDEDDPLAVYQNEDYPNTSSRDDVPLPSVKVKKKKRKQLSINIRELPNVTHQGDLFQKGLLMGTKRHCVISDHRLLCFKSDKDTKPIINVVLVGYDILFMEKEGKYSNLIRISHPGCETHWFYAENKEYAEVWMKHLNAAASGKILTENIKDNISQNSCNLSDKSPSHSALSLSIGGSPSMTRHAAATTATMSSVSSSEGSGDGVVQPREPPPPPPTSGSAAVSESDRRKISGDKKKFSISDFLPTFSKKKGQHVTGSNPTRRPLDPDIEVDPSASIAGILDVCTDPADGKKWVSCYCVVKEGRIHCFQDPSSETPDYSLILGGLHIGMAPRELKRELGLRLIQGGQDKMLLEPRDSMEQGRWLNVLIKETGYIGQGGAPDYNYIDEDEEFGEANRDGAYDEVNAKLKRAVKGYDDDGYVGATLELESTKLDDSNLKPRDAKPRDASPNPRCKPPRDSHLSDSYDVAAKPLVKPKPRCVQMKNDDKNDENCDDVVTDDDYENVNKLPLESTGDYIPCDLFAKPSGDKKCENYMNCGGFYKNPPLDDDTVKTDPHVGDENHNVPDATDSCDAAADPVDDAPRDVGAAVDNDPPKNDSGANNDPQNDANKTAITTADLAKTVDDTGANSESGAVAGATNAKPGATPPADTAQSSQSTPSGATDPSSPNVACDPGSINSPSDDLDNVFDEPVHVRCRRICAGPGPPPLPKTAPPVHRLSARRSKSDVAGMFPISKRDSRVEDEVEETFSMIKAKLDSMGKDSPERRRKTTSVSFKEIDGHSDIIKCHSGPTISEDQEILQTTKNPILSEIRKTKRSYSLDPTEKEKMEIELGDMRRKCALLRKKRAEIRGKKLNAKSDHEKERLMKELLVVEKDMEDAEKDLTKLQLVVAEKSAQEGSRSDSFRSTGSNSPRSSPSSPRSHSLKNFSAGDPKKSDPLSKTFSSKRTDRMGSFLSSSSPDFSRDKEANKVTSVVTVPGGYRKTEFSTRTEKAKLSNGKPATFSTTSTVVTTSKRVAAPPRGPFLASKTTTSGTEQQPAAKKVQPQRGATKDAISKWNDRTVTSSGLSHTTFSSSSSSSSSSISPRTASGTRTSTSTTGLTSRVSTSTTSKLSGLDNRAQKDDSEEATSGRQVKARLQLWENMKNNSSNC